MRVPQPEGARGSLKWIQRAVARHALGLDGAICAATGASRIEWRSPLASDDHAEYRDGAFLDRLDLGHLRPDLRDFWPQRGPQWDALDVTDRGDILLVEAKAHIGEMCSPPSQASPGSHVRIAAALAACAVELRARPGHAAWTDHFYQLANRLAFASFLRRAGVPAWLVLVNFTGDGEMRGPQTATEWRAAYQVAWHVMGLSPRYPFAHLIEVFPDVEELA